MARRISLYGSIGTRRGTYANNTIFAMDDAFVSVSLDSAVITQNQNLFIDDSLISVGLDPVVFTQNHILATQDLSGTLSLDQASLSLTAYVLRNRRISLYGSIGTRRGTYTEGYEFTANDLNQAIASDTAAIQQQHGLFGTGVSILASLDAGALQQHHILSGTDLNILMSLGSAAIHQQHILSGTDVNILVSLDAGTFIIGGVVFTPASLDIAALLDSSTQNQNHLLSIDDAQSAMSLDVATLTSNQIILPTDLSQAFGLDVTSLIVNHNILSADVFQTFGLDIASASVAHVLSGTDVAIVTSIESPLIPTEYVFVPAGVQQLLLVDVATLYQLQTMSPADASHSLSIDVPAVEIFADIATPGRTIRIGRLVRIRYID